MSVLEKRNNVMAEVLWAVVAKTSKASGGHSRTNVIFSIHDYEWMAWYQFVESPEAAFGSAEMDDTARGWPLTSWAFGSSQHPIIHYCNKPLRVDEFAAGSDKSASIPSALARLTARKLNTRFVGSGFLSARLAGIRSSWGYDHGFSFAGAPATGKERRLQGGVLLGMTLHGLASGCETFDWFIVHSGE